MTKILYCSTLDEYIEAVIDKKLFDEHKNCKIRLTTNEIDKLIKIN